MGFAYVIGGSICTCRVKGLTTSLEHMEEDSPDASNTLPRWVFLEYAQMLDLAGPSSTVIFAHLSKSSCEALNDALHKSGASERRAKFEVQTKGVMELMREREIDLKNVCLLDPKAGRELAPQDGEGTFRWFVFGVT
jgi:ribosome biogenesis SPOUT family RNA methylase Rps3